MSEEERLIEEARRSAAETEQLREETLGDGHGQSDDAPVPDGPLPEKREPEPWAKTSSGDADSVTDDEND